MSRFGVKRLASLQTEHKCRAVFAPGRRRPCPEVSRLAGEDPNQRLHECSLRKTSKFSALQACSATNLNQKTQGDQKVGGKLRATKLLGKAALVLAFFYASFFCARPSGLAVGVIDTPSEVARVQKKRTSGKKTFLASVKKTTGVATDSHYLSYRIQQLLAMSVWRKMLALCALTIPVILVFGVLYHFSSQHTLSFSLFKSYALLTKSGVQPTDEENTVSLLWMNLMSFLGVITFGVFLGLIVGEINEKIFQLRSSSAYKIYESNHIVILNWNRFTLPILKSISRSQKNHKIESLVRTQKKKKTVVVIADKEKDEMDHEISVNDDSLDALNVIARSGAPTDRRILEKASVEKAEKIIILQDDDSDLDRYSIDSTRDFSNEIGSLLSLNRIKGKALNIVLQSNLASDTSSLGSKHPLALAADLASRSAETKQDKIAMLSGREIFGRVIAASALENDFWEVFQKITLPRDRKFSLATKRLPPRMKTVRFRDLPTSFPGSTFIGVIDGEGKMSLNPDPERKVCSQDNVIILGDAVSNQLEPRSKKSKVKFGKDTARDSTNPKLSAKSACPDECPRQIAVLNFDEDNPISMGVIQALLESVPETTRINCVREESKIPSKENKIFEDDRISQNIVQTLSHESLLSAGISSADSILILQGKGKTRGQQDAESQVIGLYLFDIFKDSLDPPNLTFAVNDSEVLSEMRDVFFSEYFKNRIDVISNEELISNLFTKVSSFPELNAVLYELLRSIRIVEAKSYIEGQGERRGGGTFDYASVCQAAMDQRDIVLGYKQGSKMNINPSGTNRIRDDAKLIVLSKTFEY